MVHSQALRQVGHLDTGWRLGHVIGRRIAPADDEGDRQCRDDDDSQRGYGRGTSAHVTQRICHCMVTDSWNSTSFGTASTAIAAMHLARGTGMPSPDG